MSQYIYYRIFIILYCLFIHPIYIQCVGIHSYSYNVFGNNMITNKSQRKLERTYGNRLSLPKLRSNSQLASISQSPNSKPSLPSISNIPKSKRSLILLKQIRPAKDIYQTSSQSDGEAVIKRIITPEKGKSKPEIAVLSLNHNKKQRVKNRYVKQVFVGEQAIQKFYDRYKHMDKYQEKQQFNKQNNVITQIVQLLDGHGFAPRKLDLIKLKGSHAILDLKKLGLGHGSLGTVVTQLIGMMGRFQYVDLSSNRIDRNMSEDMVSELGKVKIINLNHNRIGKVACDRFAEIFLQPKTQIQQLYLSDNNLMDNAGASLIKGLMDYNYLRVLDLSRNFMANKFAQELKQYLSKDRSLEQLYLGWNQINDKSAKLVFEAVDQHTDLKVFDYSWNMIGFFSVNSLAKLLRENQSLIHVDISFCDIDKKNSSILAKALQSNHSIYGIHFQGNSGIVDRKGFIKLTQKQHHQYPLPIVKGLIRKIDSIRPNQVHNQYKQIHLRDICWICDSWQEVYFNIKNNNPEIKQCYLHLKSQDYKSIKMVANDGFFQTYRMLKIGQASFFFTFSKGPGQKQHFASTSFPMRTYGEQLQFSIGQIKIKTKIEHMNYYQNEYIQDVIDQNYFANIHCIPRSHQVSAGFKQVKKILIKKKVIRHEKLKTKYRELDESGAEQFLRDRGNRDDDKEYLLKCLEYDIANSKMNKLIKQVEDINKFKYMMLQYYRDFKDSFYYLASGNPAANGIYSVAEVPFQQFLQQQKYITKRVTHAKIMLKMLSCLTYGEEQASPQKKGGFGDAGKKQAENRLFCRPQFLQFLVRLALQKWCIAPPKPKKKKEGQQKKQKQEQKDQDQQAGNKKQKLVLPLPLIQGLERTMKTLPKYADRVRASIWRKQKYLTIDIYTVIKGYETFLTDIFDKYSENKKKLDKPKKIKGLLTLEQFKNMFIEADIKRTKQAAKDCEIPYLDSKRLQVQDGSLQLALNYNQFCQCLARYSEIIWFPPVACEKHQLWQFEPNRRFLPLFIRFEALIVNLYRRQSQFHTRRMNKIAQYGLFLQESQVLLQQIKELDIGSNTDLAWKINSLQQDEITLKDLIEGLKQKYQNTTIQRQQQIEQQQQRIDDD